MGQAFNMSCSAAVKQKSTIQTDRNWMLMPLSSLILAPSGFWIANSKLGPILDGQGTMANVAGCVDVAHPSLNLTLVDDQENAFLQKIEGYFRTEEFGNAEGDISANEVDKLVLDNFNKNLKFDEEKVRYIIELPFKFPEII
jgi:hypothetical protein